MPDRFENMSTSISGPLTDCFDVTPDDANDLPEVTRSVHIGGDGDLRVTMQDGGTVTLKGYKAGDEPPLRVRRIWATGTTATEIVGLV